MRIVQYHAAAGNFGDDLNDLLWARLLPPGVRAVPDIALIGIGSILDARHLDVQAHEYVSVIGSGASAGALPADRERFDYLAVRGPLTAALIERPAASATDAAALLSIVRAPAAARERTSCLSRIITAPREPHGIVLQSAPE